MSDRSPNASFGSLLRGHRHAAGLSLAELAAASGVSVRGIGDMERGRSRRPQTRTVLALAEALGLDEAARRRLTAAVRGGAEPAAGGLPAGAGDFTGRDAEMAAIARYAAGTDAAVVVVAGPAGTGKTTLAVEAGRRLGDLFPDGVHFADLRGMDVHPPGSGRLLAELLTGLGVPERGIPAGTEARAELLRSTLAGKRALIVLDNAAGEQQVRPLLPRTGGSVTLITARRPLAGLEAVHRVHLDTFDEQEAIAMLDVILGHETDRDDVRAVTELCGRLPLALRIAGNRAAGGNLRELAGRLGDERARLAHLSPDDQGVAAAFQLSYRQLGPAAARVFRRLTLVPGADAGLELATTLAGLSPDDTEDALDELVDLGLLHVSAALRYGFHDLVRLFAGRQLTAEEDGLPELTAAMVTWLLDVAGKAGGFFSESATEADAVAAAGALTGIRFGRTADAEAWLRAEGANWLGAMALAERAGRHREVLDTAEAMHWFSDRWPYWGHWGEVFERGRRAAAALGDRVMEATQINYLSWVAANLDQQPARAADLAWEASAIAEAAGDLVQQAWSQFYVSGAEGHQRRWAEASAAADRAATLFLEHGDAAGACTSLNQAAFGQIALGRPREALERVDRALAIIDSAELTNPNIAAILRLDSGRARGRILTMLERYDEAIDLLQGVAEQSRDMGAGMYDTVVTDVARAQIGAGRTDEAKANLRLAIELADKTGGTDRSARYRELLADLG
ncbi:helix-turn-helix transcriptional regulator [Actinoplanes sp. NPDC048796]|uniref:helix-turn-helix transcriptional regulator n=1 Tax=unclassified Actinoplanes TaxID=2626549 RepID=UPI0033DABCE0